MTRLLLVCCLAPLLSLAAAEHALDGTSFAVQFAADGKALDADVLRFADGKGELPALAKRYGFEVAAYTVGGTAAARTVTITMLSRKHGQIVVAGTIAGDRIEGTRTWTKGDKDAIVHQFNGTTSAP